ncbi:hypothetical protein BBP40_011218 [Aspergillus hancockii]|nr:hypothetical protein BBP40_011218 [Aspergillus hancockii]
MQHLLRSIRAISDDFLPPWVLNRANVTNAYSTSKNINDKGLDCPPRATGFYGIAGIIMNFSWLADNMIFEKWRNDPAPSILHIYGSSNITAAAEYVFQDDTLDFSPILDLKFHSTMHVKALLEPWRTPLSVRL